MIINLNNNIVVKLKYYNITYRFIIIHMDA